MGLLGCWLGHKPELTKEEFLAQSREAAEQDEFITVRTATTKCTSCGKTLEYQPNGELVEIEVQK